MGRRMSGPVLVVLTSGSHRCCPVCCCCWPWWVGGGGGVEARHAVGVLRHHASVRAAPVWSADVCGRWVGVVESWVVRPGWAGAAGGLLGS